MECHISMKKQTYEEIKWSIYIYSTGSTSFLLGFPVANSLSKELEATEEVPLSSLNFCIVFSGRTRKEVENRHIRHMLEGEQESKKSKMMSRYIQSRSKVHEVID